MRNNTPEIVQAVKTLEQMARGLQVSDHEFAILQQLRHGFSALKNRPNDSFQLPLDMDSVEGPITVEIVLRKIKPTDDNAQAG